MNKEISPMRSIQKIVVTIIMPVLLFASACASQKENLHRGWIGGAYIEADPSWLKSVTQNYFEGNHGVIPALPELVRQRQDSAILISRVFGNTPAAAGGLREGDLILEVDHRLVEDLSGFRKAIDRLEPGVGTPFTLYRNGEITDQTVVIGRETFQSRHSFTLGLGLGNEFDPIPDPDFTLFSLIRYQTNDNRLELHSPEFQYYQAARRQGTGDEATGNDSETETGREGWNFWLVFFGFGGNHVILSQEMTVDDI
ncbi:MAG: hypothetical protein C0403_10825 [Desulfobacterium sp.]|nr:hypothetical protein [Desulfobacterium sp.]